MVSNSLAMELQIARTSDDYQTSFPNM